MVGKVGLEPWPRGSERHLIEGGMAMNGSMSAGAGVRWGKGTAVGCD